jgi:uncharacterized protein YqhQ
MQGKQGNLWRKQMKEKKVQYTSIGGQAVIEGVMMRGPKKTSVVVRLPDGSLKKEIKDTVEIKNKLLKLPFIRGSVMLASSLSVGMWALNYSASFYEEDTPPSKFEKWLMDKLGEKFNDYLIAFSITLGVMLAIGLFFMLPTILTGFLSRYFNISAAGAFIEGGVRIAIFLAYLKLVGLMPDIKRVFSYHGAEHKTIACFEQKEELTVENVRKYKRFHPRCGTSFLLIVMVVSIIVFSFLSWENVWMRLILRLLLLPLVVGISYELIKLAGKYDNKLTQIISAPGLALQKLTTQEPDDAMIEVAIEAMKDVIPEDAGDKMC